MGTGDRLLELVIACHGHMPLPTPHLNTGQLVVPCLTAHDMILINLCDIFFSPSPSIFDQLSSCSDREAHGCVTSGWEGRRRNVCGLGAGIYGQSSWHSLHLAEHPLCPPKPCLPLCDTHEMSFKPGNKTSCPFSGLIGLPTTHILSQKLCGRHMGRGQTLDVQPDTVDRM